MLKKGKEEQQGQRKIEERVEQALGRGKGEGTFGSGAARGGLAG